jgi:phosphoribosylglycinamide formyltransferase-1
MLPIAILISGRGSNMQALIEATATLDFPAHIVCVVSNKADAGGLAFAQKNNIPTHIIDHRDYKSREDFDHALDETVTASGAKMVCLAGFMRLLTPWFVERWRDRLINIHPSLLPAFPGLDTHKQALEMGVKFTGCTVHFVRAEMDKGPIIVQAAVPIMPHDDEETLAARVLAAEHKAYPHAVRLIAESRVNIHDERVFITEAEAPHTTLVNPALAI